MTHEQTIRELERRIEELGDRLGQTDHLIATARQEHALAMEKTSMEYQAAMLAAADHIKSLEGQLVLQSAQFESRTPTEELLDYQKTNAELVEFVQKVADSRTKFAPDAKVLLGQ